MAEKKKSKKRKEESSRPGGEVLIDKPTKEEFAIAKWMRGNVPIKRTKFINHNVEYFTARRAVDILLESKWAKGDNALFGTREEIVDFLHLMLVHKFFHRARKLPVSEHELRGNKKRDKKSTTTSDDDKTNKDCNESKEKIKQTVDGNAMMADGKTDQQLNMDKEKRKKKIRLDMHNDQVFVDGLDAYVWIYDPIPFYYWIIGSLVVVGAIGVCLFPLWPPSVRLGVYYLSVAAAGFLVTIILLAVLRLVMFCLIWLFTFGKHHLWILPNLTEDVGFFASFWPLYTYEYKGSNASLSANNKLKKDKQKKKKDKLSDNEDDNNTKTESEGNGIEKDDYGKRKISSSNNNDTEKDDTNDERFQNDSYNNDNGTVDTNSVKNEEKSESESESSQRSSTGKDFEMLDQEDLDT